ncbi:MAG: phosphoribosyltransferase family protein [Candidatus Paceibacterota bacterium]
MKDIMDILKEVGAYEQGHFVLASSSHADFYINKDAIFVHPQMASDVGEALALKFKDDNVEVVIAPATAGIVLSQWTAYHLSKITGRDVLAVYADKTTPKGFIVKRGYDKILNGKRVLVVEDVLTSGGSVRLCIEAVREAGGNVIGLGGIVNRGKLSEKDVFYPGKFVCLANIDINAYLEDVCPLCLQRKPIRTDLGKGAEYLARKNKDGDKK